MRRLLLILAAAASLTACGFRPLYADAGFDGTVEGQAISVDEIPGRSGYMLRRNLIEGLAPGLPGLDEPARLTVTLDEGLTRAALLPDGGVSRSFFNATGTYVFETADDAITGKVSVQIPYSATSTPYTDVSAQISASERAMSELSRKMIDTLRIQVKQGG